jgi:hypothetical protein
MRSIERIDHGGYQGRFSATRRADNQNQAAPLQCQLFDRRRKIQRHDAWDFGWEQANGTAETVGSPKDMHPECTKTFRMDRNVTRSNRTKTLFSAFVEPCHNESVQVCRLDDIVTSSHELSIDSNDDAESGRQVYVRGSALTRGSNQFLDAHDA